jgi:hypothetical protein
LFNEPKPPAPQVETFSDYEVWIVARRRPNGIPFDDGRFAPGHAFIGIIARSSINGAYKPIRTYSFWPENNKTRPYQEANSDLTINYPTDFNNLNSIINGQSISDRGFAVRKSKISNNRANWIMNGAYREAGCIRYFVGGVGTYCHCMDYSTRFWHFITAGREDFRIRAVNKEVFNPLVLQNWDPRYSHISYHYWPDALTDAIQKKTNQTGSNFVDGNNVWQ